MFLKVRNESRPSFPPDSRCPGTEQIRIHTGKEAIVFPSNTAKWAMADGLSPSKLRELRHMSANLESADSLILDPGAVADIFVSFRPVHFAPLQDKDTNATRRHFLAPPKSPVFDGTSSPPRVTDESKRQVSSSSSSSASSIADAQLHDGRSDLESVECPAFDTTGTVTIRAWPLPPLPNDLLSSASTAQTLAPHEGTPPSSGASNLSSSSSRPASYYSSTNVTSVSGNLGEEDSGDDDQCQVFSLPFFARSCRPQLGVQLGDTASKITPSSSQSFHDSDDDHSVALSASTTTTTSNNSALRSQVLPRRAQNHGAIPMDFGDIFVGDEEEHHVVLVNQSDIDIFWQAKLDDADPAISFLDDDGRLIDVVNAADDDGDDVGSSAAQASAAASNNNDGSQKATSASSTTRRGSYKPHILHARSSMRLRIALHPREPCRDFEQVVTLTNMHNASNSVRISIRANMLGAAGDNGALAVLSGDVIDFGDCAGGHWTKQLLVLKNNCEGALDVHFSVDKGVEAEFQLAELLQQSFDQLVQDEPPHIKQGEDEDREEKARRKERLLQLQNEAQAQEAGKTPTSHAREPVPSEEPPVLDLCSTTSSSQGVITGSGGVEDDSSKDVDASSVASQAGSLPGSPVAGPSKLHDGLVLEPPPPSESGSGKAFGSDGAFRSRPTSGLFSTHHQHAGGLLHQYHHQRMTGGGDDNLSGSTTPSSQAPLHNYEGAHMEISSTDGLDDGPSGASAGASGSVAESSKLSHASSTNHHRQQIGVRSHNGGAVALSGLRNLEQPHRNQLEELILKPGGEYRVIVSYRPPRKELSASSTEEELLWAGRLVERAFRISLDYARTKSSGVRSRGGRERKTVMCRTRTCTSLITLSPKSVDFGEANVGTKRSEHIAVRNLSELTARVDVRFVSKVLSTYRDEVAIPALQTVELRLDLFPRRVNESYRKQVTVANLLNRHNDQIFEVRSKNVDRQRVSFHSLFYRILTPTGSNFIDFGDVNINSTRVRTFSIENLSDKKLSLEMLAAHSEDLRLFVKKVEKPKTGADERQQTRAQQAEDSAQPDQVNTPATPFPNRYAELEAGDAPLESGSKRGETSSKTLLNGKSGRTGADLKERFLETMSQDSPAPARRENATWRGVASSHHRLGNAGKKTDGQGPSSRHHHHNHQRDEKRDGGGDGDHGAPLVKPKPTINLVSALKKGAKGRLTATWGRGITFKDRSLISVFEYLDLASGPPVDSKRIPAKSKRFQLLDSIEAPSSSRPSKGAAASSKQPKAPLPRLPSPLAKDIHRKGSAAADKAEEVAKQTSAKADAPALTGKRKAEPVLSNPKDVSKLTLDELVSAVEGQSSSLSTFFLGNPLAEEQSVRTEVNLERGLRDAIEAGRLEPVEVLTVDARSERQVVAVYTPNGSTRPHIQGNARKQDSRIFLRLVDFDREGLRRSDDFASMADLDADELPVRDLMIRSTTCRSLVELGQPHINFGQLDKGEARTRRILIQNRSEWALRFCIRKSGSIASGDIKLSSSARYGVVPGHGKREVEFIFSPSLTGQFQERLVVENVADRDQDQTVWLKANVRKVPNFAVLPTGRLDFGELALGKLSQAESIVVSNTTAKARTFVLALDTRQLRVPLSSAVADFDLIVATSKEPSDARLGTLSKAEEEEVEHISQKLKIASRKGQKDKVKKYEGRLTELGIAHPSSSSQPSEAGAETHETTEEPIEIEQNVSGDTEEAVEDATTRLKRVSSTVTLGLGPGQGKKLLLRLRPRLNPSASAPPSPNEREQGHLSAQVRIHEIKNQDETRIVDVCASIEEPPSSSSSEPNPEEELPRDVVGTVVFSPE